MKRTVPIVLALAVLVAAGVWWLTHRARAGAEIVLYGNVDLRQVELPFNNSERVAAVLVQEGDHVRRGQLLARLETTRLAPQLAQADASVSQQEQVVSRLHNGSRPQEVAQARANVAMAAADAATARRKFERLRSLAESSGGRAVSRQDLDDAQSAADVAAARLAVNRETLDLAVLGPRAEDIAEAEARLRALEAQRALLRQQMADAQLTAPLDAVVRSRIVEPGEMASPQKAAFTLAITDPKWVRAYLAEPDLGRVRPGMPAGIGIDAFPGHRFQGWVGFISPVAEFTPKSVQTEELRSSLVYEIRVFVKDPEDQLRLGMPATVYLAPQPAAPRAQVARDSPP